MSDVADQIASSHDYATYQVALSRKKSKRVRKLARTDKSLASGCSQTSVHYLHALGTSLGRWGSREI